MRQNIILHEIGYFLSVIIVLICFGYNNVTAQEGPNNNQASATGKFTIDVEPAISINYSGDVDLGEICPGCERIWQNGDKCLIWEVGGGTSCNFRASYAIPINNPTMLTMTWKWMYQLNGGTWMSYLNDSNPNQGAPGNTGNIWNIGNNMKFRVCALRALASTGAVPSQLGGYNYLFTMTVNYVSNI